MTETELRIVNAALDAFLKFGPKKTTMRDIADAAGLTRQTVYVTFGSKDNVFAALLRFISHQQLTKIAQAWADHPALDDKLRLYLQIAVLDVFDTMNAHSEPQDWTIGGTGDVPDAYQFMRDEHTRIWAAELAGYATVLARAGTDADRLGRFIVTSSFNLKKSETDRGRLVEQLSVLSCAVLALTS